MKTKDKLLKAITTFTDKAVDRLLAREVPIIREQVKIYAIDLANKKLPAKGDVLTRYLPQIKEPFQVLLEKIHQLMGAMRAKSEMQTLKENYAKEETVLIKRKSELEQDLRLLKKEERKLNNNLGHIIRNWRISLFFLVLLSFGESILNYKIFLLLASNNLTALISSIGVAISLFILSHVFKDILDYFKSTTGKWIAGLSVTFLVTGLLYGFARLRILFLTQTHHTQTEALSEWIFVVINLTLFLAGALLVLFTKPDKKTVSDYRKHRLIGKQIQKGERELAHIENRLAGLTKEKNEMLGNLYGILLMARHYEKVVNSEFFNACALFASENTIARKDDQSPQAFLERPSPLKTYFDEIDSFNPNTA